MKFLLLLSYYVAFCHINGVDCQEVPQLPDMTDYQYNAMTFSYRVLKNAMEKDIKDVVFSPIRAMTEIKVLESEGVNLAKNGTTLLSNFFKSLILANTTLEFIQEIDKYFRYTFNASYKQSYNDSRTPKIFNLTQSFIPKVIPMIMTLNYR